jgi:hypothetical protein
MEKILLVTIHLLISFRKANSHLARRVVVSMNELRHEWHDLEMFENLFIWVILLVVLLTPISASPFTSDTVVSVTVGVLDRYHSTCVYLLHSGHQGDQGGEFHENFCRLMSHRACL